MLGAALLGIERFRIKQSLRRLPLRISVTGTRGKSTVTRLISAVLTEAGYSVLAKTTGSRPVILLPDGSEREIVRRGGASILEGRKLISLASRMGVKAFVAEMMSIHPEAMQVESEKIIQPHILVITNVRVDHIAQWGFSREQAAQGFAHAIPKRGTVFIPQEEIRSVLRDAIAKRKAALQVVPEDLNDPGLNYWDSHSGHEFAQNRRLTVAVAGFLGINRDVAIKGMKEASPDFGGLRAWQASLNQDKQEWFLVSGFAANDPESSRMILDRLRKHQIIKQKKIIGLLNLRKDRVDRTWHWLEVFRRGFFPELDRLVVAGEHASVFKHRLSRYSDKNHIKRSMSLNPVALKPMPPAKLMDSLLELEPEGGVVLGLGNMGGMGEALVSYWEQIGRPYVL